MTGARNRGSEALVSSIMYGLSHEMGAPNVRISLHTQDAVYDREHLPAGIDAIHSTSNMPPSRLSPAQQRCCFHAARWAAKTPLRRFLPGSIGDGLGADLIVATGGDTFTSDYGTFHRHVRTLHVGTPVALLAQTIGPFTREDAKLFVASTRNIVICTVRESETLDYVRQIAPHLQPQLTADVAFLLPATAAESARAIVEVDNRFGIGERPLVGLSISAGVLSYRGDLDAEHYINEIAAFVDDLNCGGWSVLLLPHVQENWKRNNDIYACRDVFRRVSDRVNNAVLCAPMSASDFKGVIGLCQVLVGARMHATIASMSQGIPTVAIAYSRKAWAIMRDYYGADFAKNTTVDVAKLDRRNLRSAFDHALSNGRTDTRAAQMRTLAAQNFPRIRDFLQQPR
ncbi:MAG: colanic acid/amylovoran biosynthesis protein [Gammaproteobacteria bacterium]|nr:colanic acid/amylovoran biosynthesis protein [Gammaproteobacteria bacterium]